MANIEKLVRFYVDRIPLKTIEYANDIRRYYGGRSDRGQLEDIKTGNIFRWARMKHLAPIFSETKLTNLVS